MKTKTILTQNVNRQLETAVVTSTNNTSIIVRDGYRNALVTKDILNRKECEVCILNTTAMGNSDIGFNPLKFITNTTHAIEVAALIVQEIQNRTGIYLSVFEERAAIKLLSATIGQEIVEGDTTFLDVISDIENLTITTFDDVKAIVKELENNSEEYFAQFAIKQLMSLEYLNIEEVVEAQAFLCEALKFTFPEHLRKLVFQEDMAVIDSLTTERIRLIVATDKNDVASCLFASLALMLIQERVLAFSMIASLFTKDKIDIDFEVALSSGIILKNLPLFLDRIANRQISYRIYTESVKELICATNADYLNVLRQVKIEIVGAIDYYSASIIAEVFDIRVKDLDADIEIA